MAINLKSTFFWWEWVEKMIWDSFWWLILFFIILWIPFLRPWWWFFLPIMLFVQLKTIYLWYMNWDFDYAKTKWVLLEITPPKEILAPLKAMEDVFAVIWPLLDHANFRERWCDGELDNGPYWCSFEIASIEGKIHFYARMRAEHRNILETALYAHYPDMEIKEVADYAKIVPHTVPNDEWDMYGEDYVLNKPNPYPIKTYEKFFEPQGERISAEEKRIDPILSLLEGMSRIGPGEHFWMQFITVPVAPWSQDEPDFWKEGEKIINKIIKRPEKKEPTLLEDLWYVIKQVISGPEKEGPDKYTWVPQQKEESGEREMVLTPGERTAVTEIGNKLGKPCFRTTIRCVYVAKRENWKAPNRVMGRAYFAHFSTQDLNGINFTGKTRPRIHYFWRKRRVFLRARKMFRMAVLRFPPLFPKRMASDLNPILSSEEMATMYHFPLRTTGMIAPSLEKVESKKAGPPPNLPVE